LLSFNNNVINCCMMFRTVFLLSSVCVWLGSHGLPASTTTQKAARQGKNGYSCETNDWDKPQWCLCQPGEKVSKIYSKHSNKKEDRQWTLTCSVIEPEFMVPARSDWYEVTKETVYDKPIKWDGEPEDKFLVGMSSKHSNKKEDRQFKFFTVRSDNWYLTDCKKHKNLNDWDEKLEYTLGDDEVFAGLESYHSNKKEDRLWTLKVCKLRKKCTEISKINYDTVKSEVTSDMVAAGGTVFDNTRGQSDNSFTATISSTASNSLTESYSYAQTSGWTNEVSMSVTAGVKVGVPAINEYSLEVSVGASHSWSSEETWTRSSSKEYSETNGRQLAYTAFCKAGCYCKMDVVVKTVKGVIPYTMYSQSVDKKHKCVEKGELTVDYAFDGRASVNDVCPS